MSQVFSLTDNTKLDNTKTLSTDLYPGITMMPLNSDRSNSVELGALVIGQSTPTTNDTSISLVSGVYAKNLQNGGYIQIPYVCPGGTLKPNATFVDNLTSKKYKTANLYIFNATHMIENISYDAEMVIELNPITNGGEKLYLCFLLSCQRNNKLKLNEIDNIIVHSMKMKTYKHNSFNLQPLIDNNQQKIFYKSNTDRVVIFTKPIKIKEYDFSNYSKIPSNMFISFPTDDYVVLNTSGVQEGFTEGLESIMTCTPINTGEPDENDNSVIITNTAGGANLLNRSLMAGIMITVILLMICLFVQPTLYFFIMANTNVDPEEKMLITGISIVLIGILGLFLVFNGSNNDISQQYAGIIIVIYLILSVVGILFNTTAYNALELKYSVGNAFIAAGKILNKIGNHPEFFWIPCIILILFFFIFGIVVKTGSVKSLKNKKINNSNLGNLILGFGITYSIVLVSIIMAFSFKVV